MFRQLLQLVRAIGCSVNYSSLSGLSAVVGALSLYLNFINLILMLLRFFGGSRR